MTNSFRRISIYGKGGVGKTFISTNVAIQLSDIGRHVSLIGCSPKTDTTIHLLKENIPPTILENIQKKGSSEAVINECFSYGFKNILCSETGGPEPAAGCAGRGVFLALDLIRKYKIFDKKFIDFVIYDVIADVVCGGFSQPMKSGFSDSIYIVTTSDFMSLYAANNICNALEYINQNNDSQINIGGIIHNKVSTLCDNKIVDSFSEVINIPVIARINSSKSIKNELIINKSDNIFSNDQIITEFQKLSQKLLHPSGFLPTPIPVSESIDVINSLINKNQINDKPIENSTLFFSSEKSHNKKYINPEKFSLYKNKKIAMYGKAGIGKSTTSSNLSASLSIMGENVLQIGCDPKRDSVILLTKTMIPTILEFIDQNNLPLGEKLNVLDSVLVQGFNGIWCAESGGPLPGTGCAGQGVSSSLEFLLDQDVFSKKQITFTILDILGDVVCGGFSQPMRKGLCDEIYIVTDSDPLSLLVANNICKAVNRIAKDGTQIGIGGIIANKINDQNDIIRINHFCEKIMVPCISFIPKSEHIKIAESQRMTVVEKFPESEISSIYTSLAEKILSNENTCLAKPIENVESLFQICI